MKKSTTKAISIWNFIHQYYLHSAVLLTYSSRTSLDTLMFSPKEMPCHHRNISKSERVKGNQMAQSILRVKSETMFVQFSLFAREANEMKQKDTSECSDCYELHNSISFLYLHHLITKKNGEEWIHHFERTQSSKTPISSKDPSLRPSF